jgi:hypothetical protein
MGAVLRFQAPDTPPDKEREREQAFQDWLLSTETAYLECRNGRHIFPGLTDRRTDLEVRQGVCYSEAPCPRCGTVLHKLMGVKDGYLVGVSSKSYEYPDGYLLPPEATGTGGSAMDRDHRAMVRKELMERAFRAKGTTLAKEVAAATRREEAARRAAERRKQQPS